MTERPDEENQENRPPERPGDGEKGTESPGRSEPEADLRSLMGGSSPRRDPAAKPRPEPELREEEVASEDEVAPPYVPPVREGDPVRPPEREPEREQERPAPPESGDPDQKMPPVWPGDEDQPWFRRERGLPPLPGSEEGTTGPLGPEDLPTPLAEIPVRGRAFGISVLLPQVMAVLPIPIGGVLSLLIFIPNLFLFSRGQDVGAVIFGLRVLRDNGEVAGFFHMFVRNAASWLGFVLLGAGYWGAFSDPARRTWHDKWLKTYVVKDAPEYKSRKRSSSDVAYSWFWVIILLTIAVVVMIAISAPPPTEMMPPPEGGGGPPASQV